MLRGGRVLLRPGVVGTHGEAGLGRGIGMGWVWREIQRSAKEIPFRAVQVHFPQADGIAMRPWLAFAGSEASPHRLPLADTPSRTVQFWDG